MNEEKHDRISFITTCMGRLDHLKEALPAALRNAGHEYIVVDFSCPQGTGDWVEANHPGVKVVRVPGEEFFHVSRARNLGAAEATAEWICFFDADIILREDFAEGMQKQLAPGGIYRSREPRSGKWGTHLVRREDFFAVGQYDEVMRNYGGEDDDLYRRYSLAGLEERKIPPGMFRAIPHGEEMRTAHFRIREMDHSNLINLIYSRAKLDLMQLRGAALSVEDRMKLRQFIMRAVKRQGILSPLLRIRIPVGSMRGPPGRRLYSALVYQVRPDESDPRLPARRAGKKRAKKRVAKRSPRSG